MTLAPRAIAAARPVRGRLAAALLLGVGAASAAVALTGVSAWLISRAAEHPPVLHLMVAIVGVRAFGLLRGVLRYLERLVVHDATFRILGELRVATVARLARVLPGGRLRDGRPLVSGDLLARFVDDVDSMQDLWSRVALPYATAAVVAVGTVGVVTWMVPAAGAVLALSVLVAGVAAPGIAARAARTSGPRLAVLRAVHHGAVLDLLDGATELAVYDALDDRLEALARTDVDLAEAQRRTAAAAGAGAAIAAASAGVATWFALAAGAGAVADERLAAASLAVVVLLPGALHEIIAALATAAQLVPGLRAAAARVDDVLSLPDSVAEPATPARPPTPPCGVVIDGVVAGWRPGAPVLRGLSLQVPAGERVVISGASGCGKSTLAALLLRLLTPEAGEVRLEGADGAVALAALEADDAARTIGWCAQQAHVFDSTVEANLRLARPDASDAELARAVRLAGLAGWVASLPDGLATPVGEHGRAISGGQRQRLALARTLLADRPVVVFDEPTENLDEETAVALAHDLLQAAHGRTTIVLTHRPELFAGARHLVLRNGELVAPEVSASGG